MGELDGRLPAHARVGAFVVVILVPGGEPGTGIGKGKNIPLLLQNTDDLIFSKPTALHLWSFRYGQSPTQTSLDAGVHLTGQRVECRIFGSSSLSLGLG